MDNNAGKRNRVSGQVILQLLFLFLWSSGSMNFLSAQTAPGLPPAESLSHHPLAYLEIGHLRYAYLEAGNASNPTIFFLHGFPDLANTWDETLDALSGEYHCIAPFLRGYYPTDMAEDNDYRAGTVARDINALAEKMGIDEYYVVGQDWGASVAYHLAVMFPERVKKVVAIAIPYPKYLKITPGIAVKARHFLKFRNEEKSPPAVRKDDFHYIDKLFERWSPGWENYAEASNLIKSTFQEPGRVEAALGYYWSLNDENESGENEGRFEGIPEMPILTLAGKDDGALTTGPFKKMQKAAEWPHEVLILENAGHFLHREIPEVFIRELKRFLQE